MFAASSVYSQLQDRFRTNVANSHAYSYAHNAMAGQLPGPQKKLLPDEFVSASDEHYVRRNIIAHPWEHEFDARSRANTRRTTRRARLTSTPLAYCSSSTERWNNSSRRSRSPRSKSWRCLCDTGPLRSGPGEADVRLRSERTTPEARRTTASRGRPWTRSPTAKGRTEEAWRGM